MNYFSSVLNSELNNYLLKDCITLLLFIYIVLENQYVVD